MSYPVQARERGTGWSDPHLAVELLPSIERLRKQCFVVAPADLRQCQPSAYGHGDEASTHGDRRTVCAGRSRSNADSARRCEQVGGTGSASICAGDDSVPVSHKTNAGFSRSSQHLIL
jgi:hypothetical protein